MVLTLFEVDRRGITYPVVTCDWSSRRILDVDDGNVYWLADATIALYFNHQGCAYEHDERRLSALASECETVVLSEHLEVFLAQLLGNTGRPEAMPVVDRNRLYETRGDW